MKAFEYDEIRHARSDSGAHYLQFLSEGTLSLGLYVLEAGATDPQSPHTEDEVYYVVRGRATIDVDGERQSVQPGSMVFVGKNVAHRFIDVEEELEILVLFAPEHRQ